MILEQLREHRIITILRGIPPKSVRQAAQALYDGGIRMLEITFDQSSSAKLQDTAASIQRVREQMGDRMIVGAGTVLTVEEAETAHRAGASFILSPNTDRAVIERAKELGMGAVPGAFTPSEIVEAYQYGADVVKLFPAGELGINYIKAITAPLSHIPLLIVGGVDTQNISAFLSVAAGVGIGSNLAGKQRIADGRFEELTVLAKQYVEARNA